MSYVVIWMSYKPVVNIPGKKINGCCGRHNQGKGKREEKERD